jgi:hypothetical protein
MAQTNGSRHDVVVAVPEIPAGDFVRAKRL